MDIIVLLSLYDIKMWYFRQKEHKGGGWGQSYSSKEMTSDNIYRKEWRELKIEKIDVANSINI